MNLSKSSVKRPVTTLMIILIILMLGFISLTKLSIDLYPELDLPVAVVSTGYEGAGPEEIENIVTKTLEEQVGTLNGIDKINSTSSSGSSLIIAQFDFGTDMEQAVNDIRNKVDRVKKYFPDEVDDPLIMKMDPNSMPIIMLGATGDKDISQLERIIEDKVQPRLERISGVASVDIVGGKTREIHVELDPFKLQSYGLSLNEVKNIIASENRDTSGGYIEEGVKDYLIKAEGQFDSLNDLENILIPLQSGGSVKLKDIADVKDTFKETDSFTLLNGEPSIGISIYKQSDANTVNVSDSVLSEIKALQNELGKSAQLELAMDQAEFIRKAIDQVKNNAMMGAILAVIVLFVFLRNFRSTIIIGTAIPFSIISTFILMYFGGQTLNVISLGGLSLGIGMMVDSAIVILENIYRYRQNGHGIISAAIKGSGEVSSAIVASTLTSLAVFLPMVFVDGMTGQIFKPLALTVVFSLTASLLVALTLIPMLCSKYLILDEEKKRKGFFFKLGDSWIKILDRIDQKYRVVLNWALRRRKTVIISTIIALVVSIAAIPMVGMEFMPSEDSGEFSVSVELPNSTLLDETNKVVADVEKIVSDLPELDTIFSSVGGGGFFSGGKNTNTATINVKLVSVTERKRGVTEVMDEVREKVKDIAGADISVKASTQGAGGSGSPISISIKGNDLDTLEDLAEQFESKIKTVPGTREVTTSLAEGSPEISLKIDREKASLYGVTSSEAFQSISTGIKGTKASVYRTKGDEYDIKVMLPENNRSNIDDLKRLMVKSMQGVNIPIEEIAKIDYTEGPTHINREDQSRKVDITGDISGRDLGSIMKDIKVAVSEIALPLGYEVQYGGSNKDMMESFQSLLLALILAIFLVYMVLASQFEALLDPFIIMFSLPPTLIGIIGGLVITGRSLSVPAFIGIIMLAGIVVNNAIVLVDYINTLRKNGMERKEAILKAGPTRLRPILMTTLTTVLALVPQTLALGEGAESMAPMATVVVFGLSFSTLITLVLIPVVYDLFADFKKKKKQPVVEDLELE